MSSTSSKPLGWLDESSGPALQAVVRAATPDLADLPIALEDTPDLGNPIWASGRATVGGRVFAKFAFSEPTAVRIWREAQALGLLNDLGLAVPKLIAAGRHPAFLATELVRGGAPLTYQAVTAAAPERIEQLAAQLADFLSQLHAPHAIAGARERLDNLSRQPEPGLHVSTDALRTRFTAMIEPRQRSMVTRWCDWIDNQLTSPVEAVFVHGDFHPYNQLWDLDEPRLLAVMDFENSGLAEPELDFRGLPAFGPNIDLLYRR